MQKPFVLVVEPASSGLNYIDDIVKLNYRPLVLEREVDDYDYVHNFRAKNRLTYASCSTIISEKTTYEETLKLVKKFHPIAIVACAEMSVELATRLQNDLNLPAIPYNEFSRFTNKFYTHDCLRKAGLRNIQSKLVSSVKEGLTFYSRLKNKKVVVKPPFGAGAFKFHTCYNKEEVANAIKSMLNFQYLCNIQIKQALVQEFIEGEEYFINTISRNKKHRIISAAVYSVENDKNLYIHSYRFVDEKTLEKNKAKKYIFDVLDALGIEDGPVHSEIFIDKNGPILIETNIRICGGDIPSSFYDKVYGHHDSMEILKSLVSTKYFNKSINCASKLTIKNHGAIVCPRIHEDCTVNSLPIVELLPRIKSFYSTDIKPLTKATFFKQTIDFISILGQVFLVNHSLKEFEKNLKWFKELDQKYSGFVYEKKNDSKIKLKIDKKDYSLIRTLCKNGTGLLITDEPAIYQNTNYKVVGVKQINRINNFKYASVILDVDFSLLSKTQHLSRAEILKNIFVFMDKLKLNGSLYIPSSTYSSLLYQKKGFNFLGEINGLTVKKYTNKKVLLMKRKTTK